MPRDGRAISADENISTIRHWIKLGLLDVVDITPGGYQLFSDETLKRVQLMQSLKKKRYTLHEIKNKLRNNS